MNVLDTIRAYSTPLTLVLVIFGPQILNRSLSYLSRRKQPQAALQVREPLSRRLQVFLALHTLYHLSHILIPPFDLFSTPHIPILAPNDILRSRFLRDTTSSNALVDLLLSRLQNLDNRLLYIRFGHRAIQECLWCMTPLDYLIAALPEILGRYVMAAAVIMVMGSETIAGKGAGRRAKRWGRTGIWVLGVMCIGELGIKYFWDLRISGGDCLHLSHTIHSIRTSVLLVLPLLHTFLPPAPPSPNPSILLNALQNAQNTQRLTTLAHEAIQQDGRLLHSYAMAGRQQAFLDQAVRSDPEVIQAVQDYRIGETSSAQARHWVEEGWNGLMRIHLEKQVT